jgi:hypothetical protein
VIERVKDFLRWLAVYVNPDKEAFLPSLSPAADGAYSFSGTRLTDRYCLLSARGRKSW